MASTDVSTVIDALFSIAGVQRVVSIDDMNAIEAPVEEALALTQKLQKEDLAPIFANYPAVTAVDDLDIRLREIRKVWENESDGKRRFLLNSIRARVAEIETRDPQKTSTELTDENTFLELSTLFAKYGLQLLSLKQWQDKQGEIISQSMPPTLFLVDEDFSKEEGGSRLSGIAIIKAVMGAAPAEKMLCALLTHNPRYQPATLHESWKALCEAQGLDPGLFVLIPKKIMRDDPIGFCRLVKLALLNRQVGHLKQTASDILHRAHDNAHKRLDDIDIYDFDQIVFRSSWKEGVWEPDTLFRVFGLFHHDETRKLAKNDQNLYAMADSIRTLSLVPTKSSTAPNYNTIALQRLELYEEGEYLNAHFTPLDVGDIFQKTGESNKRYILLAQSCDLMVRADGKRNPFVSEATVAEIIHGPIKDRDGHSELPFLDENDDVQQFVSFKRIHAVKLTFLDLCALNKSGEAALTMDAPAPDTAIPAWKSHYERLVKECQKLLNQTAELTKTGTTLKAAAGLVARASNSALLTPTLDLDKKTVSFNFKRIARLRQPRAAALLARFANYMARQAFEHDLGDYEEQATGENPEQAAAAKPNDATQQPPAEPPRPSNTTSAVATRESSQEKSAEAPSPKPTKS